jgi:hypothetical protein
MTVGVSKANPNIDPPPLFSGISWDDRADFLLGFASLTPTSAGVAMLETLEYYSPEQLRVFADSVLYKQQHDRGK